MFSLPELPYAYDALEPYIDAATMNIHHTKHHAGYTSKLNTAVQNTNLEGLTIQELLSDPDRLPADSRQGIINNGGGYYNHLLFRPSLSPDGGGDPQGAVYTAIVDTFGDIETFRQQFSNKALSLFGSGWVYLCKTATGELVIKRYSFQDTPLKDRLTPLLGLDVWEHAYYLHYQNRRAEYIAGRRHIIDWGVVHERFTEN